MAKQFVAPTKGTPATLRPRRQCGAPVVAVPGGSTVKARVTAIDHDGDPLHYKWGASDGRAANVDAAETTWTLPLSRGLHFLYHGGHRAAR